MTTPSLGGRDMHERLAALRAAVAARPEVELGPDGRPVSPPEAASAEAPTGHPGQFGRAHHPTEPGHAGPAVKTGSLILAVETSCDETSIALVEDGRRIHSNVVASQVAMHAAAGGIVPEVAAQSAPALDRAGP